jgi:hypothetical protein
MDPAPAMDAADTPSAAADRLQASISDLMNYDFEVVDVGQDDVDLEAGCLSCS